MTRFDVVITTFDILKAKEAVVPEEISDNEAEDVEESTSLQKSERGGWIHTRRGKILQGGMTDVSNLHLINWQLILIDINSQTDIRPGNAKGNAIRALKGEMKIGMIETSRENEDTKQSRKARVSSPAGGKYVWNNLRDVMGIPLSIPLTSITFCFEDWRDIHVKSDS